jgi:hypothetical protein
MWRERRVILNQHGMYRKDPTRLFAKYISKFDLNKTPRDKKKSSKSERISFFLAIKGLKKF